MPKIYYTSEGYKIEVAKVTLNNHEEVGKWLERLTESIKIRSYHTHKRGTSYDQDIHEVKIESKDAKRVLTQGNPVYIFRNLEPNHPELSLGECHLVTSETFAKMDLRKPHYLMQLFQYKHLPQHLQEVSKPICELAEHLDKTLPNNPEKTTALRKLREAKDCAVTAVLFKN